MTFGHSGSFLFSVLLDKGRGDGYNMYCIKQFYIKQPEQNEEKHYVY